MKSIVQTAGFVLLVAGCASAQPTPATMPTAPLTAATSAPTSGATSIDGTLDRLDQLGKSLKSFTADATLTDQDSLSGAETARTGKVYYEAKSPGESRIRVTFLTKQRGSRQFDEKLEYVLQNGTLVDRNYETKVEVKRQVLKPGEKVNLLKLGEGPFPLPIGQDKAEVHRLFEVTQVPTADGDPANTVHLRLAPKPQTQFEKKFIAIDVWVDGQSSFPVRIDAADANQTNVRSTLLKNVKTNPGLTDNDFKLLPVEGWNLRTEEYAE